jgi:hypothetical protein
VILRPDGRKKISPSPLPSIGVLVWGPRARALAISSPNGALRLLRPDGTVQSLPTSWYPLAWSPDGRRLLVQVDNVLELWTVGTPPANARNIGPLSPGFGIRQASWMPRTTSLTR